MINYKPIEKLHQSVQGSDVLKVQNLDTKEICVLKLVGQLNNKLNRLIFKREIAALRKLNQFDDIVKVYDSSDRLTYRNQAGYGGILLELIPGKSFDMIDFSVFSDLDKAVIFRNCARAILHAHQCGILHRDIKPSNIMLIENSLRVKVIDFGNSKLKSIVDEETTKWHYTKGYVAPEVAQGSESTEQSDIYSLGAVFCHVLYSRPPIIEAQVHELLGSKSVVPGIVKLLAQMLAYNIDDRICDIQEVVNALDEVIGDLNTSAYRFWFYVDTEKLTALKRQCAVENSMSYASFMAVYLPDEFSEAYGIYNNDKGYYEFVGKSLYMKCYFEKGDRRFVVAELYEIPIDKATKLKRIFGIVEGNMKFCGYGLNISGTNSSTRLEVQLRNFANERSSYEAKNRRFEELFGKWRESIVESLNTIKSKGIKIKYDEYWFLHNNLYLKIKSIEGAVIDEITQEVHFVFAIIDEKKTKVIPIGNYEDCYVDGEKSIMILSLDKNINLKKLESLLQEWVVITEDQKKQTVALRRQLSAIAALKDDEYNTAGLKDVFLELSVPTCTYSIQSLRYFNKKLNDSQQQAIKKAIYSNSISLIQGPPGTGKTSVIAELVQQILQKALISDTSPRILVVSQSHTAVDNILEKLSESDATQGTRIVRIGRKEDVSNNIASKYLVDAIKDEIFSNIYPSSSAFIQQKLDSFACNEADSLKAQKTKEASLKIWNDAKEIHADWIKRCSDTTSLRYQIVSTSTVIAGTCIGFLSDENVRDMLFDYAIVDEAAKATTPELLVSIIRAEKIVLVGDQNQLPPYADSSLSELSAILVKDPHYRIFDILYDSLPDTHKQFLATQYRMCSTIGNLISKVFYDGKLITGVDDLERQHSLTWFENKAIVWIDTSRMQKHSSCMVAGGSSYNLAEVQIIRKLLEKMKAKEDAPQLDIGIITGYRAQKEAINKVYRGGDFNGIGNIDINTLDAFQGRENDIIIYSTVRTHGAIGFQQEKERVNVAFSRAKRLLIVCGDIQFFETWDRGVNKFTEIVHYLRSNAEKCLIVDANEVLHS